MESTMHPSDTSGNETQATETIPSLGSLVNSSAADEPSAPQLQLSITLERLRLETTEKERLLELVRLEQLRLSEAAEERKFRADQAERDRELEKIRIGFLSDRRRSESWREKLVHFAGSTTMHGAPKIIISESLIRRLVWLLCFIGSWAMFFIQLELVFRNYFTYPKNTNLEIGNDHPQFPDLTFCHRRRVSSIDAHEWLMRKHERQVKNETLASIMKDMKLINSLKVDVTVIDPIFHSAEFQKFIDRSAIQKREFFLTVSFKSFEEPSLALRQREQIPLHDIKEIPGGKFLRCFTVPIEKFNNRTESIDGYFVTGNWMIPDMSNESEYPWRDISSKEVAVVYLHQPGVKINPIHNSQFYDLQPNHAYDILVNVNKYVRLGHPYGQCSSSDPFVQGGRSRPDVPYRQQDCELSCMANKILERDGKVSMRFPPLDGMRCWVDENGTLEERYGSYVKRWCNYTALETDGHPGKVKTTEVSDWRFEVNSTGCPCYPPCHETEYDVSVTSRSHPFRNASYNWLLELFMKHDFWGRKGDNKSLLTEEYLRRNKNQILEDITKLSITIGPKVHETIESPRFTRTQLISEIGGQLGVWIGISVITLVEVIELMIDLCAGCLRRGRKKELETSGGNTQQDGNTV